jgi:peptidoglycan DL-endopeptidase CwlO|uniref:NlpC/P60 family protein n=1 Tax=Aquiluna sp. TaxID=2053504 RepID=UPI004047E963
MRKNAIIAALSGIGLVAGTLLLTPAYANPDYPTAAEVAAAKRDVQEKEKLIERIESLLVTLEEEARALETIALQKNEEYNQAIDAKNEMAAKVESLQARVEQSATEAEEARLQLGRIVAQMFRDRSATDTTLELLFNPDNAESLLFQMSMEEIIAQRTEAIYQAALDKQAQAEALALELEQSRIELEEIEAEAEKLYQEAQDAADAVIAKVAESERERATMMEQLAELKDTAEEIERQRQEGLEWERRQAAIRAAPTAPELYSVGEPDWAQVETAIAFASEQLGERYVLGGAGPNVWDCSGITMKSYAAAGVYIGWHSATAQYNVLAGQKKLVPFQNAQRGDLIWWSTESAFSGDKYHVAIYLGDGMMLEAPNPARTVRIVPVRYGELWPYAGRPTASSN